MSGGRLEVADRRFHHDLSRVQGDDVDGTEVVAEGFGEAQAVAEEVGCQVVAGSVTAEGVVGGDQEQVSEAYEEAQDGEGGQSSAEGGGEPERAPLGTHRPRSRPLAQRATGPS